MAYNPGFGGRAGSDGRRVNLGAVSAASTTESSAMAMNGTDDGWDSAILTTDRCVARSAYVILRPDIPQSRPPLGLCSSPTAGKEAATRVQQHRPALADAA